MKVLDAWYAKVSIDALREHFRNNQDMSARLSKKQKQARSQNSEAVIPKLTEVVNGHRTIKDSPPVIYHFQEYVQNLEKGHARFIEEYKKSLQTDRQELFERYRFQDAAIKVVGVGSVGTRCYLALFLAGEDDPLFLQVKEARILRCWNHLAEKAATHIRVCGSWRDSVSCKPRATSFSVGPARRSTIITFVSSVT